MGSSNKNPFGGNLGVTEGFRFFDKISGLGLAGAGQFQPLCHRDGYNL